MDILKLFKNLKAEDVPVLMDSDMEKLQSYLRGLKIEIDSDKICKEFDWDKDRVLDLLNRISIHWRDNLAPKVFFKSMLNSDMSEFEGFFKRPDVDLNLLCMTMVYDIRKGMKSLGSPSYQLLLDNWKKYRGY